jgi:Fe-S cluster biosynthesis and repair protein YggX
MNREDAESESREQNSYSFASPRLCGELFVRIDAMALFGDKFKCGRCGQKTEPMGYAPIPTELGQKIGAEMCQSCWKEWLQKQNQLINHFGIDVSNPDSHDFLFDNMKIFFYNEGVELAQIDTSKEGSVNW